MVKNKLFGVYDQVRSNKLAIILVALLAVNTLGNIIVFAHNKANSDFVSYFLLRDDFFKNNVFLPPDNFFLKLPYYFLSLDLFGYTLTNLTVLIIFNALILFGAFFACYLYFIKRNTTPNRYFILALTLPCFLLINQSSMLYSFIMHTFCRNAEIGIFFLLLLARAHKRSRGYLGSVLMLVVMVTLFFSDPYWMFVFALPFIAAIVLLYLIRHTISNDDEIFLYYLLVAVLISVIYQGVVGKSDFFTVFTNNSSLAPLQHLGYNFRILSVGMHRLFGGFVSDNSSSFWAGIGILFNFGILFFGWIGLVRLFLDKLKSTDSEGIFIPLCYVLTICAYVFSTLLKNIDTTRYLIVLPFLQAFGLFYFLQHYVLHSRQAIVIYSLLILAVPLHILVTNPSLTSLSSAKVVYEQNYSVIDVLREENLEYGYAEYGDSPLNTYLAQNQIKIRQVNYWFGQVSPHQWMSSERWYDPEYYRGPTFFLLHEDVLAELIGQFTFEQLLPHQFGSPLKVRQIRTSTGNLKLFIYDYNIASRFESPVYYF